MTSLWRVRVYGIAASLLLSAVSIVFHISLGRLPLLIYAAAGIAAGRLAGVSAAVYTGVLVPFVSGTLVLAIWWLIDPGKWPMPLETGHIIGIVARFVVGEIVVGGILGLIGGVLGRWSTQRVRVDA